MLESGLPELPQLKTADLPADSWDGWLLTQVASALDTTMLQAMRLVVDAVMIPKPADLPEMQRSAEPFLKGELWEDPRRFFSFVDEPGRATRVAGRFRRPIDGGAVIAREFTAAYRPFASLSKLLPGSNGSEIRFPVEHWMHDPGPPLGTVVALHGFSMGYPRLDAFALFAAQCFQQGFDVALLTLPFHGPRTPPDARFSGERFAAPHATRLNEAVRQAIYEIHVLVEWLRQQTDAAVGLLGLSLGGYLSALMAGLTPDLDFVISMVPPACMGDLAWRFYSRSRRYRNGASPAFSREELRAAYRVHSPLTYPCRVEKERLLILAGRGDQIVPPDHPHALWRSWEEPEIYWFSGSHLAPFRRGRLFAAIAAHLERCVLGSS